MLTAVLRVAGVIRAAAGLLAAKDRQGDAVATSRASGYGVDAVSLVNDLAAAVAVELEAAKLAGGWWHWLR